MRTTLALLATLLTITLAGCGGGGGGEAQCTPGVSTMLFPNGCDGDAIGGGGTAVGTPTLQLALADAGGGATNTVTPSATGTLQAVVRDGRGNPVPDVAVTFQTSDDTGGFVPTSGTALTDAAGVARVGLPVGTQAGAFTATASANVAGLGVAARTDYAVSFPALTLEPLVISPATLSAGGNASVSVTVTSGGAPYTAPLRVAFDSPCIAAGKATMGPPVLTQVGVAATSYTDKGCGVPDLITASATIGDSTVTRTGTLVVLPAAAGSVKFLTADTTNIALKATGGFGRQEFSTLTFQVFDTTGNPVAGALVDFKFADSNATSTVGGLTLNPAFATSNAEGKVTTLVTAGTIPTSVRVVGTVRGSAPVLTTLSDTLVVSTGVPDQRHFSLSTSIGNCEGRDFNQFCSFVTATLGDHFGNPVPDGTAISFTAEGGLIGASCVTGSLPPPGATPAGQTTNSAIGPGSGSCTVELRSASPRPANGRITVLAYALGEEDFTDSNGNNYYDAGEPFTDKRPDIYRDDNEDFAWNPGEACVGPNPTGQCTSQPGDGEYNGVLRVAQQPPPPQTLYVSDQLVQIFSGSDAVITFDKPSLACQSGATAEIQVTVNDVVGNLMPAGTTIDFSAITAFTAYPVNPSRVTVNNVALGIDVRRPVPTYNVAVGCLSGSNGRFLVTVTTPNQVVTTRQVPINP